MLEATIQFPELTTKDLNSDSYTLPGAFAGHRNLILIGYEQYHQNEVNTWFPLAEELEKNVEGFRYYELPVVGKMNMFGKMQLDFWMRQGIPDRAARARTLTLYIDRDTFRQQLAIDTDRTIALLLLDEGGRVIWREMGPYSEEAGQSLRSMVSEKLSSE